MIHFTAEQQQDYKNKYYHALIIAKDWYKHIYDNFTSVADLIRNRPDDWLQVMHSLNEKEKLLSAMFPELNNSEEWWNDFYNQFYEQNKDNPEYSFVSK